MNPFGRTNDQPKQPFGNMNPQERVPMNNEPLPPLSPPTMAEIMGELGDNAGVTASVTPGGAIMTEAGTPSGDKMQYSQEGSRTYEGSMTVQLPVKTFYRK